MKDLDLDETIRDALTAEKDEWIGEMDVDHYEMVIEVFRGKSRWFAKMGFVIILGLLAGAVFSVFRFSQVESTRDLIGWATAFLFCATSIGLIKIWYWMEMSKNSVAREIKRFELQLARITNEMNK